MHTQGVTLISNQEIRIKGLPVNIHDIKSIEVNEDGTIINAFIELDGSDRYGYMKRSNGWIFPT